MKDSDELKTKATQTPKIREEGELSSAEDDGFPADSATSAGRKETIQVALVSKKAQLVKAGAGNSVSTNNPTTSADVPSRASVQPYHNKTFEKNRVPFVISFSDDDSGSDSDECRQAKSLKTKSSTVRVDGSRRPPVSSTVKSRVLRWTAGNNTKMMPRKASTSQTFVPSTTKFNGTSSRSGGPLSVEQRYRTIDKTKTGREHDFNKNFHMNDSKLQDLRQLIAVRENELKGKVTQQHKETVSASYGDNNDMNSNNDTTRICGETSVQFLQFKPQEPKKKRSKITELSSNPLNSDGRQDMPGVESMLASEKSVLENFGQQSIDDRSFCDKEILLGSTLSGATQSQKQEGNQVIVSSANIPNGVNKGTDPITNSSEYDKITLLDSPVANRAAKMFPKKSRTKELKHPNNLNCHHSTNFLPNTSVPNKTKHGHDSARSSDLHEARSGDKEIMPTSSDTYQGSLNNSSLWKGKVNISETGNMDIQSLLDIEELQDKELEEAQELRHKCEVEERKARKAYRKAQRALIEANAKCSYLYRKRDSFSAQFQSLMMDDSSLFLSSRRHNQFGAGLNPFTDMPELNMHLIPSSSHQMVAELDFHNQHEYDSNVGYPNQALLNLSNYHQNGQNLASDLSSEPDTSTSDPQGNVMKIPVSAPSNDLNILTEDEGTCTIDPKSGQPNLYRQRDEEIFDGRRKDVTDKSKTVDSSQDSLLLEATLRSQLFARLGIKDSSSKRAPIQNKEPAVERGAQNDDGEEKAEKSMDNIPLSDAEKNQSSDLGGADRVEINTAEVPVQIINQCDVAKFCSNYASFSVADALDRGTIRSVTFLSPILRSAFGCMKVSDSAGLVQSDTRHHQIHTTTSNDKKSNCVSPNGVQPIIMSSNSIKDTLMNGFLSKVGSYSSNLGIDPFWPLCMYELRGKCNNNECSWQHVRDYSSRNMNQHNSDNTNMNTCTDFQGGSSSSHRGKLNGGTSFSKCLDCRDLTPPTYLVCSDTLKTDLHAYKSVVALSVGQGWRKCFSSSLVLSCLLSTDLSSNEPFLHGAESRVEVHVGWNRQNSYFRSRNGTGRLEQHMVDSEQSLEMALLNLNQEVDKSKGKTEVLTMLARALEVEPTSVVIWIVYLHIYYSNQMTIGKDDMFHCAVEHNEGSYELWLMYINSRVQLDDRLVAYNTALSSLCDHASAPDRDAMHASECILDLFLQMMNCLCVSGKVVDAIENIDGLSHSTKKSNESHSKFLTSILLHLTIYDKCVFWVCCVYLVVYKKLPDSIVQRFECQKELSAVDWPSTNLTVAEKMQGIKLMEMAVDSLASYIDSESLESEITLKAAHLFALNHVRCIVVVEGLECSRSLLDKYVKLYPSCLELVLMSARAREHDFDDLSFVGFEEALGYWLEEFPGVQCIWNQYAESALQNGRFDFAKELMERWFNSVCQIQRSRSELLDISSQMDAVFGLLNLSLHKILQNDPIEARLAIDKALKAAATENYKHCVREHAMFLFTVDSDSKTTSGMLKILNSYLVDQRAVPVSEPLSRKFIHSIKKPRVQQLVSNLLTPISSDFSLVNLVLEVWYGPTLLPQVFDKLVDLVDLVEAIMEILPANYWLAISLCKLLTTTDVSSSVSFWASSLLVNALFQAVPVAPEYVWVEAASMLHNLTDIQSISESFHKRALLIYPFSMKMWESYLNLSKIMGNVSSIIEAARGRGIKLD